MNAQWKDEFYGPPVPLPLWLLAPAALLGLFVLLKLAAISF